MSGELLTVEQVADRLKLHRTTVLRFIHEGRLAATKVGKAYRILRADFERLAGASMASAVSAKAQVTSIVDIADVAPDCASRLAAMTTATLQGRGPGAAPLRADVIHDPDQAHLKIVLIGAPNDTAALLGLLHIWMES